VTGEAQKTEFSSRRELFRNILKILRVIPFLFSLKSRIKETVGSENPRGSLSKSYINGSALGGEFLIITIVYNVHASCVLFFNKHNKINRVFCARKY